MAGAFNIDDLKQSVGKRFSDVVALKATAGSFDGEISELTGYTSANPTIGGGQLRWIAASTVTADDVVVFAVSGVATGRWVRQYDFLTAEMAGVVLNNSTDSTAAVQRAVNTALALGVPLGGAGTALVTANITNLHAIKMVGSWAIRRGTDTYRAEPRGAEENIIYVGAAGVTGNDGLTSALPTTIAKALDTMKNIGSKAEDGIWRIQMLAGTYADNGIRLTDMPVFRNKLRLWGADVPLTSVPTTIWDGTTSSNQYAVRSDSLDSSILYLHLKNIKFIDWVASSLAGAITIWCRGAREYENIHADNISIGIWDRHGQSRITYGKIENYDTYGIAIQYSATSNVGNLTGGGVYLRGRIASQPQGIAIGRNSTVYVQGCDIDGNHVHINLTRLSRVRTQANTYGVNFNVACVWSDTMSVWTPDNGSGYPDIYPTLTELKPAYRGDMGSIHQKIERLSPRSLHAVSDGQIVVITNTTQNQLATLNNTFTPFRLPKWFLYSPTFRLDVEIGLSLAAGAGGLLTLNVQGSTGTTLLASITIPNVVSSTKGMVKFSVTQRVDVSTAHYSAEFKAANILSEYNNTANLNTASIRTNAEDDHIYRLYWTSNNANQVELFNMRTYVEA